MHRNRLTLSKHGLKQKQTHKAVKEKKEIGYQTNLCDVTVRATTGGPRILVAEDSRHSTFPNWEAEREEIGELRGMWEKELWNALRLHASKHS